VSASPWSQWFIVVEDTKGGREIVGAVTAFMLEEKLGFGGYHEMAKCRQSCLSLSHLHAKLAVGGGRASMNPKIPSILTLRALCGRDEYEDSDAAFRAEPVSRPSSVLSGAVLGTLSNGFMKLAMLVMPRSNLPIVYYAKKWGRNVKRPLKAPTDLDAGHIALQDIFLRETADGSEEFVVLEACNRCRALELKCNHALCCSNCKNFGTSCVRRGLFCKPLQSILSTQANLSSRVSEGSVPSPNVADGKGKRTGKARSTDILQLAPPDAERNGKNRKSLQLAPPGHRSSYHDRPRPANPLPSAPPPNPDTASTSKSLPPPSRLPITPKPSSYNTAPQANASSDTVPPASSMEIPDYAKAWSSKVRRPKNLPVHHDPHRIAPEDVFSIERSDGVTQLVVLQRCDRCCELRQHCDRAWPICSRCKSSKSECRHSDMSYVPLPHGYAKARAKASNGSTASTSVDDEPKEARTPNVSTNKRRQRDDEKMEKDPAVVSSTTTTAPKPIENQGNEDTETPNKRRKLDTEVPSHPAKTSATQPSVLYKGESTPKVKWTVPQHPPFTGQLPKNADRRRQPMVWAGVRTLPFRVLPNKLRDDN
ncbi:hypothetical protein BD410DRAFT_880128, partial [Rickenella mellea]